jgi:hypothetical protein
LVHTIIGRLIRHIPDKHFPMIRYAGLFSNRWKSFEKIVVVQLKLSRFQVSAQPPAKKTAGQIEKET